MTLTIKLPPVDRRLDVNHGKANKLARASAVRKARSLAALLTVEAMIAAGVKRGQLKPRYVMLVTNWYRNRVDYDNRLANFKAYQDGIFDALGANDKDIVAGCSMLRHLPQRQACEHLHLTAHLFESREEFVNAMGGEIGE